MTESCPYCGLVTLAPCGTLQQSQSCPHMPGAVFTSGPFTGLRKWAYGVIYADPAWDYETWSDKGKDRSASKHYDVMGLEAMKELPVRDLAAKDCVLLMWTTDTHLFQSRELMAAWGFEYKTVGFHWAKVQPGRLDRPVGDPGAFFMGMGHWTRANPEICLLGVRGKPKRKSGGVRRLIVSELREHSRKPDEAYDRIEKLVDGPYVELFSRTERPGWDSWGNQVGLFDRLDPVELAKIQELV